MALSILVGKTYFELAVKVEDYNFQEGRIKSKFIFRAEGEGGRRDDDKYIIFFKNFYEIHGIKI